MSKQNEDINEKGQGFFKRRAENLKKGFQQNINYEELKSTSSHIKDMASEVFSPQNQIKNAKIENFEKAVEIRGVSDFDLINLYKNYSIIFYISLLAMFICISFMIYFAITNFSVLTTLSLLSIFLVCAANAFKFSFRAFQIKYRKLCSVKDFLSKKDFFPKFNLK